MKKQNNNYSPDMMLSFYEWICQVLSISAIKINRLVIYLNNVIIEDINIQKMNDIYIDIIIKHLVKWQRYFDGIDL